MVRLLLLLSAVLSLCGAPALAAIGTPVNVGAVSDATAAQPRVLNSVTIASGQAIFVILADSEGLEPNDDAVTDSVGNTYTPTSQVIGSSGSIISKLYYTCNSIALSNGSITGVFDAADPVQKTLQVVSVTGLSTTSCFGGQGTTGASTGTSPTASSINPLTQADSLLITTVTLLSGASDSYTQPGSWGTVNSVGATDKMVTSQLVVASTAQVTYTATTDNSRHYGAAVYSFNGASGGGGSTCRGPLLPGC
jgi:hypothetical protein